MGDRGNVFVVEQWPEIPSSGLTGVCLYSHWRGTELPERVAEALGKNWRWDDSAYLTRIIFDVMTEGAHGEETGFGIALSPPDNQHPIIVVDVTTQRVWYADPDAYQAKEPDPDWPVWTFADFVTAGKAGFPPDE